MIGPSPSTTGNVSVSPLCVACSGESKGLKLDEELDKNYGPKYATDGQPPYKCCSCGQCNCVCLSN